VGETVPGNGRKSRRTDGAKNAMCDFTRRPRLMPAVGGLQLQRAKEETEMTVKKCFAFGNPETANCYAWLRDGSADLDAMVKTARDKAATALASLAAKGSTSDPETLVGEVVVLAQSLKDFVERELALCDIDDEGYPLLQCEGDADLEALMRSWLACAASHVCYGCLARAVRQHVQEQGGKTA
jgi:hypothetical protein